MRITPIWQIQYRLWTPKNMAFPGIFGAKIAKMPYLWVSEWNLVYFLYNFEKYFTYLLFPEWDCVCVDPAAADCPA